METKKNYAANLKTDRVKEADLAETRRVTLKKITDLAERYNHINQGLIKKIKIEPSETTTPSPLEKLDFLQKLQKKEKQCQEKLQKKRNLFKQETSKFLHSLLKVV